MKNLKEFLVEQIQERLLSIEIFEMAVDRKYFMNNFHGYAIQVVENYILVRYCTKVENYFDTRSHWCKELINVYAEIEDFDIKNDNNSNIKKKAILKLINDFEFFDETKIFKRMSRKISNEQRSNDHLKHIFFDMDIIKDLCKEFAEHYKDIFMLIYKYDNWKDLEDYIYNKL